VQTESQNISHKKDFDELSRVAQEAQKGKQQYSAYFAPFCGKYLLLIRRCD